MSLPTESTILQNVQPPVLEELRLKVQPFCRRYPIVKLEVFGSVAEGSAQPGSDVDLMVTFQPGAEVEYFTIKSELEDLLGCSVDFLERKSVEQMANWILRRSILECVQTIYAA